MTAVTPGPAYSSSVVPDGPTGFGVRGYGGVARSDVTSHPAPQDGSRAEQPLPPPPPAAAALGVQELADNRSSSNLWEAPAAKPPVGYDLSKLLTDADRESPWRPPPPPAATVQRPASSGSTTNTTQPGTDIAPTAADVPEMDGQLETVPKASAAARPAGTFTEAVNATGP